MGEPSRSLDDPGPDLPGFERRPAGFASGPGHVVVYGNPAFRTMFGEAAVGLPARETMLGLPTEAFALLDAVFRGGRPLVLRPQEVAGEAAELLRLSNNFGGADPHFGIERFSRKCDSSPRRV